MHAPNRRTVFTGTPDCNGCNGNRSIRWVSRTDHDRLVVVSGSRNRHHDWKLSTCSHVRTYTHTTQCLRISLTSVRHWLAVDGALKVEIGQGSSRRAVDTHLVSPWHDLGDALQVEWSECGSDSGLSCTQQRRHSDTPHNKPSDSNLPGTETVMVVLPPAPSEGSTAVITMVCSPESALVFTSKGN